MLLVLFLLSITVNESYNDIILALESAFLSSFFIDICDFRFQVHRKKITPCLCKH